MGSMRVLACFGLAMVLAGCDRQTDASEQMRAPAEGRALPEAAGEAPLIKAQAGAGLHLAYTHEIGLELPGKLLVAHFDAARDRCANDAALHCLLMHAEIGPSRAAYTQQAPGPPRTASLQVRLSHDLVTDFAASLTRSLPGEAAGVVRVVRQASTADDLGQPVADAGQVVAQLTSYLAALKVLGARLTISVSDQVKVAEETARAQTQLEEAQARQRELALRVDTEEVDVVFTAARPVVQAADPVTQVLAGAQDSLRRNAAEALAFGIAAVPWVPVGIAGLLLLWVVRRVMFGRSVRRVRTEP